MKNKEKLGFGDRVGIWGCDGWATGTVLRPDGNGLPNYLVLWDRPFEGSRLGVEGLGVEDRQLALTA